VGRPPDPLRRAALLDAATEHVLEHGLADLSLRPLATALGTSPRMLLYHFDSKEQLVTDVLARAREHQARLTEGWLAAQPNLAPGDLLRRFWRWQIADHQPFLRLFFEIYGLALQDPARFPGFLEGAVTEWLEFIAVLLRRAGVHHTRARVAATTVVAGYRGLLLDALATGDLRRAAKGLDLLLDALEVHLSPPAPTPTPARHGGG